MMGKILPRVVYQMCVHGALIVGSYAKEIVNNVDISSNDIDLLVPLENWQTVALLIPESAKPNKFGGWRFTTDFGDEKTEIDVWPDTLVNYLTNCKSAKGAGVIALDFIHNRLYTSSFVDI